MYPPIIIKPPTGVEGPTIFVSEPILRRTKESGTVSSRCENSGRLQPAPMTQDNRSLLAEEEESLRSKGGSALARPSQRLRSSSEGADSQR